MAIHNESCNDPAYPTRIRSPLEAEIRRISDTDGISLNQAALKLMRKGAGLENHTKSRGRIGQRLDRFAGTWSSKEAKQIGAFISSVERIDRDLWK
jgi:hypothetical protein